jgi:hypothetical protein
MKELPYFLLLVKKNVVLWTIITTGSFANVNLKDIDHDYWTSQFLQMNNYSLNNDEEFNEVWITITDISTIISFRSNSSKYLDNTKYYFGKDSILVNSSPYYISNMKVSDTSKKLDPFDVGLEMPINVSIGKSSSYGYYIDFTLYRKGWIDRVTNMKN